MIGKRQQSLEHDSEFREKSGYDDANKVEVDFSAPIKRLTANKKLFNALNANLKGRELPSSEKMIEALQKKAVHELLELISKTQKSSQSLFVHKELGQFLLEMLPKIFDLSSAGKINKERNNNGGAIVSIRYGTSISAEILMACSDNRSASFKLVPINNNVGSKLQVIPSDYLLSSAPESGVESVMQQQQDISYDMYTRYGGTARASQEELTKYLYDEHTPKYVQNEEDKTRIKKFVQMFLKLEFDSGKPSLYWIIQLTGNDKENEKLIGLAEILKKDYPQISFIILDSSSDATFTEFKNNYAITEALTPKETP